MAHEELGEAVAAPEVPKSPCMLRPHKDKKTMGPVRVSPRNPRFGKLSMVEKGKVITIETKEEEEDLQALITKLRCETMRQRMSPKCIS